MTTENQTVDAGTDIPGEAKPSGVVSKYETQAIDMGWVPKEDWVEAGHDPEDHRSAKEFVERDSLYKRIKSYSTRVGQLERQLAEQSDFQARLFQEAQTQALKKLKEQHAVAVEDGDIKKADQLVDEITRRAAQPIPIQPRNDGGQVEFEQWANENSWYKTDKVKTKFADQVGAEFAREYMMKTQRRPTTTEVLEHVEKEIAENFKAERPRGPTPPAGETRRSSSGNRKGGLQKSDLSEVELEVMTALIKSGDITEEKYLSNLDNLAKRGKR